MAAIPRTLASAKRSGFATINVKETQFTPAQRSTRIDIDKVGAGKNHIVSIVQDADDPNSWLVKYADPAGGFTYVRIPKGQPIP